MPSTTLTNTVVNAAFSYTAWICLILSVSERLPATPRTMDWLATMSKEELTVLLDRVDWDYCLRVAGNLHSAVMGDDGLTFADEHVAPLFTHLAKRCGFVPKLKMSSRVEDIRFCSMMMWPVDDAEAIGSGITHAPGPTYKALMKYGAFQTPTVLKESRLTQELRGKALGLLPITSHVPILHQLNKSSTTHSGCPRQCSQSGQEANPNQVPCWSFVSYVAKGQALCC